MIVARADAPVAPPATAWLQKDAGSGYITAMGATALPHFQVAGEGWRWWLAAVATARPHPKEMPRDHARRVPALRR